MHKLKIFKSKTKIKKLRFMVVGNIFHDSLKIDRRYELKGN